MRHGEVPRREDRQDQERAGARTRSYSRGYGNVCQNRTIKSSQNEDFPSLSEQLTSRAHDGDGRLFRNCAARRRCSKQLQR
eukprot:5151000-Prymnesium_polylepis.1